MRTLSRHFVARYLRLFVWILGLLVLAAGGVEMLLHFEELFQGGADARDVLGSLSVRVASRYGRELLAASSFGAAFLAVGVAARARETLALRAGGIAPVTVLLPLLAAATGLSAGALLASETAFREAARRDRGPAEPAATALRRGSFWYHRDGVVYNIGEADPATRTLRDVVVLETGPAGRLRRRVDAPRVEIDEGGAWRFRDAVIRRFEPEAPAAAPRLRRADGVDMGLGLGDEALWRGTDPDALALPRLLAWIEARERAGNDARLPRAALHARLSDPVAVAVFALVALPLGLLAERRGLAGPALAGAAAVAGYFAARAAALFLAGGGSAPALAWLPAALLAAAGILALARAPR